MRGPRRFKSGFTLVEVLLASSLTVVVGLAVASLVGTMRTSHKRLKVRSSKRAILSAIERRITADMRGLVPPGGLHASGLVGANALAGSGGGETLLTGEMLDMSKQLLTPGGEPAPIDERDELTMAVLPPAPSYGSEMPIGEGALWQVIYKIDDDPETTERGLVRAVTRVREPATGSDPEPVEELAQEVVALNLNFFDGSEWTDTWDSSGSDTLPQAVALDLVVQLPTELFVYRILVAPPTARPSQLRPAAE